MKLYTQVKHPSRPHEKKMLVCGVLIVGTAIAAGWFAVVVIISIVLDIVRFFS